MGEERLIDANKLERRLIEGDGHDDNRFTEGYNFAINEVRGYIADMPTVEAQPVGTEKCKALRNIEGIRLILSNVYNTGSTLQDCDYDAIFKRLDVIENILKGE